MFYYFVYPNVMLNIMPGRLHERVSVILGSRNEVDLVTAYHRDAHTPASAP